MIITLRILEAMIVILQALGVVLGALAIGYLGSLFYEAYKESESNI